MASPDKAPTKTGSKGAKSTQPANAVESTGKDAAPGKQSARSRRAAQEQQRQRQQTTILAIVAVAVVVVVVVVIGASLIPKSTASDVTIPNEAKTLYTDFASGNMIGKTAEGFPYLGKADAPHLIEEIGSLSCPVCQSYHDQTFTNILDEIKAGRAKFVFIPTTETGDYQVQTVTQGAYCAIQQNKFWEYQETLYNWQQNYIQGAYSPDDTARLTTAAGLMGMDKDKFASCIGSQAAKDYVDSSNATANKRGMTATPTIILDGKLIYPLAQGQHSPDLNELRGLLEAPGSAPAPASTASK